jgi:transcriptional regulator with XRE-family HTH domain
VALSLLFELPLPEVGAGVHRTYIGMIERGEKNITIINIEKIAKALGLSLDEITKL